MLRILVLSDSHRDRFALFDAIEKEPTAEIVYFLGDGCSEAEEAISAYSDKLTFIAVRGNCDMMCDFPPKDIRNIGGKRIYATHGYAEMVKYGLSTLKLAASSEHCDIALFGHTHEPLCLYENGLYLFNPGSLKDECYGVIDITPAGILCTNKKLIY